ncbi:MAG: hypothetical protein HRU75_02125 [Planctomycetia bacterium]|nr:MAG: hypothetical protein HRU75_02125 [Planctomycetia bacterium]
MTSSKRKAFALSAALIAGAVFQFVPTGCGQYLTEFAASAVNFCSVLNCTGGSFFNFCTPQFLLVDCPLP